KSKTMIKAIALDHKTPPLMTIRDYCSKINFIQLEKIFTEPAEALCYLKEFSVDLVFLSIRMPSISGIEFSKMIKPDTMIIFMTAHREYAVEAFNLNAVDYLLKPFSFERFAMAAKKAAAYYELLHLKQNTEQHHLFVRADYSLVKIAVPDILYIEALDDYLKIHVNNQKTVVSKMTMKSMLEKLQSEKFVRVHRSFIVPLNKIKRVGKRTISLAEKEIPIGMSYKKDFKNVFSGLSLASHV
ncbi:MAG TPA: LytTR family DNA-binding domain-containing protein, partial [Bacteroidia bacterium]|nr:LytTR family DNA-binding domain-containing protein [Bacteroidia bacterium]